MIHRHMPHVLDAATEKYFPLTAHDRHCGAVNRSH